MTTLTIHIEDKKSEKAVKAVLEALGVSYQVEETVDIPLHLQSKVLKAKEDIANGRVKPYKGLDAILSVR